MTSTETTTTPEHVKFESITRFNRKTIVSEKIHGANMGIHIMDDGSVHAQSRKNVITTEKDVNGFARWVKENENDLRAQLGYGLHFGEWFGQGVQKGHAYGQNGKSFALFNTSRWESAFNREVFAGADPDTVDASTKMILPDGSEGLCQVVPVLAVGMSPWDEKVMQAIHKLKAHGSYIAPDQKPEGIVIFHDPSQTFFKVLVENDELPKSMVPGSTHVPGE